MILKHEENLYEYVDTYISSSDNTLTVNKGIITVQKIKEKQAHNNCLTQNKQ
jgi:hypothetical protein